MQAADGISIRRLEPQSELLSMIAPCAGCGLLVEGGTAGCRTLFEELCAKEWDNPISYRVHRMIVDAYCLQHPDEYCASAKSFAAHLTGLCCAIEHKSHPNVLRGLQHWLSGKAAVEKPAIPAKRGELTLMEVYREQDPVPQMLAANRWAQSTWDAYANLHSLAGNWIERAMQRFTKRL
jgi:uncharacterized protein DUF5946